MLRSTVVLLLALTLFLGLKSLRFATLAYTFHDMYGFLQMATGWLDGRPLLYENYFGYHQRIHNYYTVLLWGPLCYYAGAYGLFIGQTLLLAVACGLTNERLAEAGTPDWARYGLLGVVLLGPVSIWLNDHTNMGWHSELTYLPLGVLFALALTGRNRVWPVAAGLGVTLVKEDGAVLAALIHLIHYGSTYLRSHPDRRLWTVLRARRFWLIGLGWSLVFGAGMLWLNYLNPAGEPRLRVVLGTLTRHIATKTFWLRSGTEIGLAVGLLLPAVGYLFLLSRRTAGAVRGHLFSLYGLGVAVLLALNLTQALYYYDDPYPPAYHWLGLTWPPRFVLLWSFTAAFLLIVLRELPPRPQPLRASAAWLVLGGLWLIELPLLGASRPDLPDGAELQATLLGRVSPHKESRYVDPTDLATVRCVAERLPNRSNVIAFSYLEPYFHKHYLIWPTGRQYRPADVAIVPIVNAADDSQTWHRSLPMRQPYRQFRLKNYYLYVTAEYEPVVHRCLQNLGLSARQGGPNRN